MTHTRFTFLKKGRVFLYYGSELITSHEFNGSVDRMEKMIEYQKRIKKMKFKSLCAIHVIYDPNLINAFMQRLSIVTDSRTIRKNKELFHERLNDAP